MEELRLVLIALHEEVDVEGEETGGVKMQFHFQRPHELAAWVTEINFNKGCPLEQVAGMLERLARTIRDGATTTPPPNMGEAVAE